MKILPLSDNEIADLCERAGTLENFELIQTWFRLLATVIKLQKERTP